MNSSILERQQESDGVVRNEVTLHAKTPCRQKAKVTKVKVPINYTDGKRNISKKRFLEDQMAYVVQNESS